MSLPKRPGRGALLQVTISRSETIEWETDAVARAEIVKGYAKRARENGRRFLEISDARGNLLQVADVVLP